MNKTCLNMKILYSEMGKAEKRIADWLISNPDEILPLSIVELADKCECSEATIVRFAKRLGFSGYQGLKISLAQETHKSVASTHISKDDSPFEIFEKVCNDIYCSLEKTKMVLNKEVMGKSAEAIKNSDKIAIFGLGNSASVALDASHKFLRAGCNAVAYSDNHMQVIAASHLTKKDVAIGISHSGSSKDIVDALKISKQHGAVTICITNVGKSPVTKHSDYVLNTASEETQHNLLALSSRISQLAIIDALYFHTIYSMSEKSIEAINETEKSLLSKKY